MVWQILTLEPLYEGMSLFDVMDRVVHHNVRPRVPMTWSSNIRNVIELGWNGVSRNRCKYKKKMMYVFYHLSHHHHNIYTGTANDLMDALLIEYKNL